MKNNDTLMWLCLWFAIVILGALFFMRECQTPPNINKIDTVYSTKTDTFWKDTTIYEKEIKEKKVVEIKRDTVYTEKGDTIQLITEAKTFEKSIISDKDTADLKIYTSGINTALDSLRMRLKTHKEVITNTVEVTKIVEKKKTVWDRFHIGVGVGYGIGLKNKDFEPFAGVSLTYSL